MRPVPEVRQSVRREFVDPDEIWVYGPEPRLTHDAGTDVVEEVGAE
jgi:hypothetical protein